MTDTLSQDQIAALFEAAKSGEVPEAPQHTARRTQRMRSVDFSRPTKFTTEHQRRITRTIDSFCLGVSGRLSAELRATVEFETLSTTQVTFAAAQTLLPANSLLATLLIEPLGERILLSVETQFVLTVIEGMLGGSTARPAKPRRFSEIDWSLSRRIMESIVHQLSFAWRDVSDDLSFSVDELDEHAEASSIASVSEPTFVVMIEARMAEQSASVGLIIPWSAIEDIADLIAGKDEKQSGKHAEAHIDRALAAVPVTLRAEVASLVLPVTDVLALAPGSVIRMGAAAGNGVTLYAENVRLARAQPGANGVRRAVQIQYQEAPGQD